MRDDGITIMEAVFTEGCETVIGTWTGPTSAGDRDRQQDALYVSAIGERMDSCHSSERRYSEAESIKLHQITTFHHLFGPRLRSLNSSW